MKNEDRWIDRPELPELLGGFLGASEATWIDGYTVKWIDQSIHVSVDRSIYPRPGIEDPTSPENLEVERRIKTGSKVAI